MGKRRDALRPGDVQMELLVPADQEAVHPLRIVVGVEREVLGLIKEFGEYGAGLYARECGSDAEMDAVPECQWRLGDPRVKSIRSGLSNWAGSRFPAAPPGKALIENNRSGPLRFPWVSCAPANFRITTDRFRLQLRTARGDVQGCAVA
jgi:hypothetical protein